MRFNIDDMMKKTKEAEENDPQMSFEIVDELYAEGRRAVDAEID